MSHVYINFLFDQKLFLLMPDVMLGASNVVESKKNRQVLASEECILMGKVQSILIKG